MDTSFLFDLGIEKGQEMKVRLKSLIDGLVGDGVFSEIMSLGPNEINKYLSELNKMIQGYIGNNGRLSLPNISSYTQAIFYSHSADFMYDVAYAFDQQVVRAKIENGFHSNTETYRKELNKIFYEQRKEYGSLGNQYYSVITKLQAQNFSIDKSGRLDFKVSYSALIYGISGVDGAIITDQIEVEHNPALTKNKTEIDEQVLETVKSYIQSAPHHLVVKTRTDLFSKYYTENFQGFLNGLNGLFKKKINWGKIGKNTVLTIVSCGNIAGQIPQPIPFIGANNQNNLSNSSIVRDVKNELSSKANKQLQTTIKQYIRNNSNKQVEKTSDELNSATIAKRTPSTSQT